MVRVVQNYGHPQNRPGGKEWGIDSQKGCCLYTKPSPENRWVTGGEFHHLQAGAGAGEQLTQISEKTVEPQA